MISTITAAVCGMVWVAGLATIAATFPVVSTTAIGLAVFFIVNVLERRLSEPADLQGAKG
jgi:hypothetical protein